MDFAFSEEQEQLKNQVRRFLDSECPLQRVREIVEGPDRYDAALWRKMAELGWQGLTVPEDYGGLGLRWEDLIVVVEEMGRTLFPSPFITNATATRLIARLGGEEQKKRWFGAIAAGELIAALAITERSDTMAESGIELVASPGGSNGASREELVLSGEKIFVADGAAAGLLLIAAREGDGTSVFAVASDAPGVTVESLELTDPTYAAARVVLDDVSVAASDRLGAPGKAWGELSAARDAATVALSAEMVGAADAAVKMSAEYAKVRKQFGQPIGRFQGIKHTLAEIYVAVESARSLTYYASWAVDHLEDPRRHVSMAKAYASEALDRAGEQCIHVHGAIGYTWECDAHFYYKRGRYCRNVLGSPAYHNERVLTAQGL